MTEKFDLFKDQSTKWYILGSMIALEVLVSVSFLGYLHIEPISITFAYIPILITGMLMGPAESTVVGSVFGLISMGKASASYVMAGDRIFSPLMSGSPIKSILLSVGTRALFGFIVGLLYRFAKKSRRPDLWIGVISFWGKSVHSLLVFSVMALLFPDLGYGIATAFSDFLSIGNLLVMSGTAAIVLLIRRALRSSPYKRFEQRMSMLKNLQPAEQQSPNRLLLISILVEFLLTCAVTVYFVGRTRYMLEQNGIDVSTAILSDLFLLQTQFLVGILALMFLLMVLQVFNRRYAACGEYEASLDTLTSVWNRKSFFQRSEQTLANMRRNDIWHGYFIMLDVDWFKQINDQFGHPEGDRVLHDIAQCLRQIFAPIGQIGRLGGDEFAILVDQPVARETLEKELNTFTERVADLSGPAPSLTCSIGVLMLTSPASIDELYQKADQLLYQAKQQGRNQYVLGA